MVKLQGEKLDTAPTASYKLFTFKTGYDFSIQIHFKIKNKNYKSVSRNLNAMFTRSKVLFNFLLCVSGVEMK